MTTVRKNLEERTGCLYEIGRAAGKNTDGNRNRKFQRDAGKWKLLRGQDQDDRRISGGWGQGDFAHAPQTFWQDSQYVHAGRVF